MNTTTKFLVVAIPAAIIAFLLGPEAPIGSQIWPPHDYGVSPTGGTLGLLIGYGVIEAAAFGVGAGFLAIGFERVKQAVPASPGLAWGAYLSIAWFLLNWLPHGSLHRTIEPTNFAALAGIEYGFHVTLIIAGATLAYFFVKASQTMSAAAAARPEPAIAMKR